MILKELKASIFSLSFGVSAVLAGTSILITPLLLVWLQHRQIGLVQQVAAGRLFYGGALLRLWFTRVHLICGCVAAPFILMYPRLNRRARNRLLYLAYLRKAPLQSLFSSRFLALLVTSVLLSILTHVAAFAAFSGEKSWTIVPVYLGVSYLSTLAALFSLVLFVLLSLLARSALSFIGYGIGIIAMLQLPVYWDNPLTRLLAAISPYAYATYMLRFGPGDMMRFMHAATILFLFVLLPYSITLWLITRRQPVENEAGIQP